MGYLYMSAALFSLVAMAFIYRWSESRQANRLVMASVMGAVMAAMVLLLAAVRGVDLRQAHISQVILGATLGLVQVVLIPVFMAAVARGDLSITWTVLSLSFALASSLVLIYPGERPTALGVVGLILAGAAVALLGLDMVERHRGGGANKPRKGWVFFIAISFVLNAMCQYSLSLGSHFQPDKSPSQNMAFVFVGGLVFAVGATVLALARPWPGSVRAGLMTGGVAGTMAFGGNFFILMALSAAVPGYLLYPATSGGSSVVVVVLSVLFLRERPGRWGWAGITAGVVALTLMGLAAR